MEKFNQKHLKIKQGIDLISCQNTCMCLIWIRPKNKQYGGENSKSNRFFFRWVKDTTISWPVHAKVQIKNQVVAINTTSETAIC